MTLGDLGSKESLIISSSKENNKEDAVAVLEVVSGSMRSARAAKKADAILASGAIREPP